MLLAIVRIVLLAVALLPQSSFDALAQANTLIIEQSGANNVLATNQSGALDSAIGGLTISRSITTYQVEVGRVEVPGLDGGPPTMQPVFEARSAWQQGFERTDTAIQRGTDNSATATLTGLGGTVGLLQDSPLGNLGNSATIEALGGSSAFVGQVGAGNKAILDVANGSRGTILQSGDGNHADLGVSGTAASGLISQIGSNNRTALDVVGNNTSVSYVVQGNNLSTAGDTALQVTTNAVSVQVTQGTFMGR